MRTSSKLFAVCGVTVLFLGICAIVERADALMVSIDLTQVGIETGPTNIAGDTWRWWLNHNNGGLGNTFDLEFSSAVISQSVDLDGGSLAGNEFYSGAEATTNHTYDIIQATYLGGGVWEITAKRGLTVYTLGPVTEFTGTLGHALNYGYTLASEESDPVNGPAEVGTSAGLSQAYKAWFWLYRDTVLDTVSFNISSGSAAAGYPNDDGTLRAEVEVSGAYAAGTVQLFQGNEPAEVTVDGGNPNRFIGDWTWDEGYDDGLVVGGFTPLEGRDIPEPSALAFLVCSGVVLLRRHRRPVTRC